MRLRPVTSISVALVLNLASCGGGGGGGSTSNPPPVQNTVPLVVDLGPTVNGAPIGDVDQAFVTLTVCTPGTTTCQTIDHVWVDTGSTGLRLVASALNNLALPAATNTGTASGSALAECFQFVSSYTWGAVRSADVKLGGEVAKAIPIQVIGDSAFPAVPTSCSSTGGSQQSTVSDLGANGILGVSNFLQDCGLACAATNITGAYYVCAASGCQPVSVAQSNQLPNPVSAFASDNNGVALTLPAVPAQGAATAAGTLTFGIGTQADNSLGSAAVLTVDPSTGYITTMVGSSTVAYSDSFIDSGSNALYFSDATNAALVPCATNSFLYCPASTQSLTAVNTGANGRNASVSFSVAAADPLFNAQPNYAAFSNIAGPNGSAGFSTPSFDWGLPFFFGRTVFVAFEGASTPAGPGPYVAY